MTSTKKANARTTKPSRDPLFGKHPNKDLISARRAWRVRVSALGRAAAPKHGALKGISAQQNSCAAVVTTFQMDQFGEAEGSRPPEGGSGRVFRPTTFERQGNDRSMALAGGSGGGMKQSTRAWIASKRVRGGD